MFDFLKGRKTYITGTIGILSTLAAMAYGDVSLQNGIAAIFVAIQSMNLRSAMSIETAKVTKLTGSSTGTGSL